jgi:RNA polymerase sigma factor (sigma-70 family)
MSEDQELLGQYAAECSEAAFAELVRRHVDLVYSAALRRAGGDIHRAQDVTQQVFTELARNAKRLVKHPALAGWLYTTTRLMSLRVNRTEQRRQHREQEVHTMNELLRETAPDQDWAQLRPVLDEAMHELGDGDRLAVLLRYFQNKSLKEVGDALGLSENAARMRVERAVEKLYGRLARRGVTSTAGALVVVLTANAVSAAPATFVTTLAGASLAGVALGTGTSLTILKIMSLTKLQVGIISATIVAGAATPFLVHEHGNQTALREENVTLRQQAGAVAGLQAENERLSNALAKAAQVAPASLASTAANDSAQELLRLRSQATRARGDAQELGQLRSDAARRAEWDGMMTNAMANGLERARSFQEKDIAKQVARMKEKLNLSDDQAEAIRALLMQRLEHRMEMALQSMNSRMSGQPVNEPLRLPEDPEAQIKALLTPEQLAAYPAYKADEAVHGARNTADNEVSSMKSTLNLTPEQEEKAVSALFDLQLKQQAKALTDAPNQLSGGQDLAGMAKTQIDRQKLELDQRLGVLAGVLAPDQLERYRQQQMKQIDLMTQSMKLVLPQTNSSAAR